LELEQDKPFMLVSVVDGEGTIITEEGEWSIRKGDHFILPYQLRAFQINGNVQMIVSHP
jgi:mannose-6-phosphate isomerase